MTTFMPPPPAATYLAFHPQDNNIIAIGMEDSTIQIYNVRVDEVISLYFLIKRLLYLFGKLQGSAVYVYCNNSLTVMIPFSKQFLNHSFYKDEFRFLDDIKFSSY